MQSIWKDTAETRPRLPLQGEISVDVAVIGAGITGLSAALELASAGKRVAVLEAWRVGDGTTGASTGNLYAAVDERLFSLESKHDRETLRQVVASRSFAIDLIEERVRENGIHCDFTRVPFHLFTRDQDQRAGEVADEYEAAQRAELPASNEAPADFPWQTAAITSLANQAQLNPRQYVMGLASAAEKDNVTIYEGTRVVDIEEGEPCVLEAGDGRIRATHVINATHTPVGIYAVHNTMQPRREFAIAARLQGDSLAPGVYWHLLQGSKYSLRPYRRDDGDWILMLGQSHMPGHQRDNQLTAMEEYLREHFTVGPVEYRWAAQNYQPADNLPYIGTSPMQDKVYIATGFAADGLVYGTLAANIIADEILGRDNRWTKVYKPTRFTPGASARKMMEEAGNSAKHLWQDYVHFGDVEAFREIGVGEGKTLEVDGKKAAAYRDDNGELHVVSSVCTHMGCVVHWNGIEKSWDCPCHGSRFDIDGRVLEGPALRPLSRARGDRSSG